MGNQQKLKFLDDCAVSSDRFGKPIKRHTILNFASDCIKKFQKSSDSSKQVLIKMDRNVFGRLLAIMLDKKEDMEIFLSYSLAPAPPALVQCNGDMHKTQKAALKILKNFMFKEALVQFLAQQWEDDGCDSFYRKQNSFHYCPRSMLLLPFC